MSDGHVGSCKAVGQLTELRSNRDVATQWLLNACLWLSLECGQNTAVRFILHMSIWLPDTSLFMTSVYRPPPTLVLQVANSGWGGVAMGTRLLCRCTVNGFVVRLHGSCTSVTLQPYEEYWSKELVQQGLKRGELIQVCTCVCDTTYTATVASVGWLTYIRFFTNQMSFFHLLLSFMIMHLNSLGFPSCTAHRTVSQFISV